MKKRNVLFMAGCLSLCLSATMPVWAAGTEETSVAAEQLVDVNADTVDTVVSDETIAEAQDVQIASEPKEMGMQEEIPDVVAEAEEKDLYEEGWNQIDIDGTTKWIFAVENESTQKMEPQTDCIIALSEGDVDTYYYVDKDGYLVADGYFDFQDNTYYAQAGSNPKEDKMGCLLTNEWKQDETKWLFFNEFGARDKTKTGLQQIGEAYYDLNADGVYQTGLQTIDGKQYYFNAQGIRVAGNGWNMVDGTYYFWDADNAIIATVANGWFKVKDQWYYGADKKLVTGWVKLQGNWYYLDENTCVMHTGFYQDGDRLYYSNASGAMLSSGWHMINNKWYYMEKSGAIKRGWYQEKGKWYYLDNVTGVMRTGWYQAGGTWFYSAGSGAMYTRGWHKINNKWYYMQSSGAMHTGWIKLNNKWYYMDPQSGAMHTGWYLTGNKWFYSAGDGAMYAGGWHKINNKWYYMQSSGAMLTGWVKLNTKWYYMDPQSGAMKTGWYLSGNKWFYSAGDGAMKTGWHKINNKWYYMENSGAMLTGWVKVNGKWYYLQESGAMKTGWHLDGGVWYYLSGSGAMVTGQQSIGGKGYLFKTSGAMYTEGTYEVNGITYKIDANGVIISSSSLAMQYAVKKLDQIGHNLRAAFNWSAGIPYYHNDDTVPSGYTNAEWYGRYGFENSKGDCYIMGSTFYWMAKALGYDVHYVQGSVPLRAGGMGPHGWCEIVMNGTTYVFDPNFTNETGRNGYQITYGQSGTWRYSDYRRLN